MGCNAVHAQLTDPEQNESIETILVDDNEQWVTLIAQKIEQTADNISVTVALCAQEALEMLDSKPVDCILADYRMPEINGIELLRRVREEDPSLPYVLMTGDGSEKIAARAMDAGVTDYVVKDARVEQSHLLVNKIHKAVEQYRLRRAIEASEERYRTVIEQSHDAIGIIHDNTMVFCNHRMLALTGMDRDELRGNDIIKTCIYADDRDQFRELLSGWRTGTEKHYHHTVRIVHASDSIRYCEITGGTISIEGETAVLVSIRDVTEPKRHERELQWERDLNRNIQLSLIESPTRADFEQSIADHLHEQGYALVWIANQQSGSFAPRYVRGKQAYVEALDVLFTDGNIDSDPSNWVDTSDDSTFVPFDALFSESFHNSALAGGYGVAVPLVYNDIRYGVLGVYHDTVERFDETERALLCELADTVGFAIHSLEMEKALASDHTVSVTIKLEDSSYYLVDLATTGVFHDCDSVVVRGTVPKADETTMQYIAVEGADPDHIAQQFASHPAVTEVLPTSADTSTVFQVTVTAHVPEQVLASLGSIVRSTKVSTEGAMIEFELAAKDNLRSTVDRLAETFDSITVRSVVESDRSNRKNLLTAAGLTDKQVASVMAAYHQGYFEKPRRNSATELAASLGISHTTFLHHLHAGQRKIFEHLFG